MTTKEIIALASAGFTMEQIAMLNHVDAPDTEDMPIQAAPASISSPVPRTPTQWMKKTPPVPAPSPSPSPSTATETAMETALQQLLARLDAMAINQSQQPIQPTADEILAQIINPPCMSGGKE